MTSSSDPHRRATVLGLAVALFLGALDQTIVSTALPRIVSDFGGIDRYTWVATAYLLFSTLLVPIYGKLADLFSRKSLVIFSIVFFLGGSALCGTAGLAGPWDILGDGMTQLIVFRGLQGMGGAGLFALAYIVIADLYPPRERGKISGLFGAVWGLASIVGPLAGGFLTDHAGAWISGVFGWRWVFWVNLPIGAVALWFIIRKMPRLHPRDRSHKFDFVSAFLLVATFLPLILALQLDKSEHPWSSYPVVLLLVASAGIGAIWVWHSLHLTSHPVLDLRLFKNRVFLRAALAVFLFGWAFLTLIIFLPLYMVDVRGYSAVLAGTSILPLTAGVVVGAGVGGPLASRLGRYKGILVAGAALSLLAMVMLTLLNVQTPPFLVIILMILAGMGFGPAQSLYALAVQNAVPPQEIGQATSFSQFSRQIGATVGAAVLGAVFTGALPSAIARNFGPEMSQFRSVHSGSELHLGPQAVEQAIDSAFDLQLRRVQELLDKTGVDAQKAWSDFEADPSIDGELKNPFKNGTPETQFDVVFAKLETDLENAVREGKKDVAVSIADGPVGKNFPDDFRKLVLHDVSLDRASRKSTLPELHRRLEHGRESAIDGTNMIVEMKVRAALESERDKVKAKAVTAFEASFSEALTNVWSVLAFVSALLLAATLWLPSLPLRGRGEPMSR